MPLPNVCDWCYHVYGLVLLQFIARAFWKFWKIKTKFSGPLLQINKQKQKHKICVFFLLDLHIAVDEFYFIHLRRALDLAQKELPISFFSENQTIVEGLSWILDKHTIFWQLFCGHRSTFSWKKNNFFRHPLYTKDKMVGKDKESLRSLRLVGTNAGGYGKGGSGSPVDPPGVGL